MIRVIDSFLSDSECDEYIKLIDRKQTEETKPFNNFTMTTDNYIQNKLQESLKEINLEINEKNLVLTVKGKYFLELVLPYFVLNNDGSAKFD